MPRGPADVSFFLIIFLSLGEREKNAKRERFIKFYIKDLISRCLVITLQENFKSGFFFIEGVFYNDRRDPLSRDYSK